MDDKIEVIQIRICLARCQTF